MKEAFSFQLSAFSPISIVSRSRRRFNKYLPAGRLSR
jgi:hypothetical protein